MVLFATPDFGAGACIMGFVGLVWVCVLALAFGGFVWATKLLQGGTATGKWRGGVLLALCVLAPMLCYLGPSQVFRINHGSYPLERYPNGKVAKGMTMDQVEEILGPPHWRYEQHGQERWYYYLDSFEIGYFGVIFDAEKLVDHTHGN
jgi:hypothetical protein